MNKLMKKKKKRNNSVDDIVVNMDKNNMTKQNM